MIISAIVAVAENKVIGHENQIPWYLPADLAFFKRTTSHHCILMGRKCFQSIGKPLPNRTNIVITRDPYFIAQGVVTVHSIEEALQYAVDAGETEAFIIGGGEIYTQSAHYWDRIYLTQVAISPPGDVFFEIPQPELWQLVSEEKHEPDAKNTFAFNFQRYEHLDFMETQVVAPPFTES
jgi:dihydrofolate reductase